MVIALPPRLDQLAQALRPALGLPALSDAPPASLPLARHAAERHRVGPLLYHATTAGGVHAEVETTAFLAAQYHTNARRVLRQKLAARRVGDLLTAATIAHVEVKGWRLGSLLYDAENLRHAKDVDLLIQPSRMLDALACVAAAGYLEADRNGPRPLYLRRARLVLRYHREVPVIEPTSRVQVELHSRLLARPPAGWQDPAVGLDASCDLTSPAYVLYLIAHGAATGWHRLKWQADLVKIAQRVTPEVRDEVVAQARHLDALPALAASLHLGARLWGEDVFAPWLSVCALDASQPVVAQRIANYVERLSRDGELSAGQKTLRRIGLVGDPPVFGNQRHALRQARDNAILWYLRKVW